MPYFYFYLSHTVGAEVKGGWGERGNRVLGRIVIVFPLPPPPPRPHLPTKILVICAISLDRYVGEDFRRVASLSLLLIHKYLSLGCRGFCSKMYLWITALIISKVVWGLLLLLFLFVCLENDTFLYSLDL